MKFPPDCNCVVNHILTVIVRFWFTRTTFESNTLTYNTGEGELLAIEMTEVKLIEPGANFRGWAIGIGGPLLGCFLRKS